MSTAPASAPISAFRPWLVAVALIAASQSLLAVFVCSAWLAAAAWPGEGRTRASRWPLVLLVLVAATVNSMKWPESDLGEYYQYIDIVHARGLQEVFSLDESSVSIRPFEVLFKLWVWAVAAVTDGSHVAFAFFSTVVIYTAQSANALSFVSRPPGTARDGALADLSSGRTTETMLAVAAAVLVATTFSVTAHLTRQYLAGAVFFIGAFAWLRSARRGWLLLCAASLLVHTSAAMLLVPLAMVIALRRRPRAFAVAVVVLLTAGLANFAGRLFDADVDLTLFVENGAQGPALLLLDGALVAVVALLAARRPHWFGSALPAVWGLLAFAAAFAGVVFMVRDVTLLFFRAYFYVEFLRAPLLALLFVVMLRHVVVLRPAVVAVLVASALLVSWVRTTSSGWDYGRIAWFAVPTPLAAIAERLRAIESR